MHIITSCKIFVCKACVKGGQTTDKLWDKQSVLYLGIEHWILFFDGCCLRWNVSEASSYLISLVGARLSQSACKEESKKIYIFTIYFLKSKSLRNVGRANTYSYSQLSEGMMKQKTKLELLLLHTIHLCTLRHKGRLRWINCMLHYATVV